MRATRLGYPDRPASRRDPGHGNVEDTLHVEPISHGRVCRIPQQGDSGGQDESEDKLQT